MMPNTNLQSQPNNPQPERMPPEPPARQPAQDPAQRDTDIEPLRRDDLYSIPPLPIG